MTWSKILVHEYLYFIVQLNRAGKMQQLNFLSASDTCRSCNSVCILSCLHVVCMWIVGFFVTMWYYYCSASLYTILWHFPSCIFITFFILLSCLRVNNHKLTCSWCTWGNCYTARARLSHFSFCVNDDRIINFKIITPLYRIESFDNEPWWWYCVLRKIGFDLTRTLLVYNHMRVCDVMRDYYI
jgi:hypothetical protein